MELSTSTNILFERGNGELIQQEEAILLCSKAGYQFLDFCFHDLITYDSPLKNEGWKEYFYHIKEISEECGITFKQGHAIVYDFCRNDVDHDFYDEMFMRCIVGSNILGIKWLVAHPSTDRNGVLIRSNSREKNITFFKKWVAIAAEYDVHFAVENMWDLHIQPKRQYCVDIEELIDLVDSVPGLGICWDSEHAEIMKIDQIDALLAIGSRLKVLHISDFTNTTDIHLLPYLGNSNWDRLFKALNIVHYDGLFNFEIHKYLMNIPRDLLLEATKFSYLIGQYMIAEIMKGRNAK